MYHLHMIQKDYLQIYLLLLFILSNCHHMTLIEYNLIFA